jgi:hypothetical protein
VELVDWGGGIGAEAETNVIMENDSNKVTGYIFCLKK